MVTVRNNRLRILGGPIDGQVGGAPSHWHAGLSIGVGLKIDALSFRFMAYEVVLSMAVDFRAIRYRAAARETMLWLLNREQLFLPVAMHTLNHRLKDYLKAECIVKTLFQKA